MGALGEQRAIPDSSGWLGTRVASGEAFSTPDDRQMRRLLGLSASPFQVVTEQSEAGEIAVLSEKIQGLIRKYSVQRAVTETGSKNMTPFLLLLTAVFALLSIFSSRYGLPKMSIILLAAVLCGISLQAGEAQALELCREAAQKTDHPDELRRAIGLYQQALRLRPGLPIAARNLEYTLLQLQDETISRQKKSNPDAETQSADQPDQPMEKLAVPGKAEELSTAMTADEQAAQGHRTAEAKGGTWRELQNRRRKIIKVPPKCNPW
jgi:hypothetical protein